MLFRNYVVHIMNKDETDVIKSYEFTGDEIGQYLVGCMQKAKEISDEMKEPVSVVIHARPARMLVSPERTTLKSFVKQDTTDFTLGDSHQTTP